MNSRLCYAYAFYSDNVIRSVTPNRKQIKYVASIELVPERAVSVVMAGAMFLDFGLKSSAIDLFRMSISLTSDPIFKTDLEYWIKTLDPAVKRNADWSAITGMIEIATRVGGLHT